MGALGFSKNAFEILAKNEVLKMKIVYLNRTLTDMNVTKIGFEKFYFFSYLSILFCFR